MTDKNGSGWGRKIFRWALTSPVTLVLGALMLYYGFRAYVLEADPWRSKAIMIGLAVLWALWLVFKNLIKFLLLAAVAAAVFYGYYRYENRNEIACREQGGVWDGEKAFAGTKPVGRKNWRSCGNGLPTGKRMKKKKRPAAEKNKSLAFCRRCAILATVQRAE